MKYKYFIGIDISKNTLDFSIFKGSDFIHHKKIENSANSIRSFLKYLKDEHQAIGKHTLCCFEYIGPYQNIILAELLRKKLAVWAESPLHIKRSLGIQRGKSDRMDATRIAKFAYLNRESHDYGSSQEKLLIN